MKLDTLDTANKIQAKIEKTTETLREYNAGFVITVNGDNIRDQRTDLFEKAKKIYTDQLRAQIDKHKEALEKL